MTLLLTGDDHSSDHRLTDVYARGDPEGSSGRAVVFCFDDFPVQLAFERGETRSQIAGRLRAFADQIAG